MKHIILLGCFVATNAVALDFDKEFANFSKDFTRLKEMKLAKLEPVSKPEAPVITALDKEALPSKNTQENVLQQVDPKSPDRLGYGITDPAVKKHVLGLYQKPDTVVYSLTLTE